MTFGAVARIFWTLLTFLIGIGILSVAWNAFYTELTATIVKDDSTDPFTLPFTVKNQSQWFTMTRIQWECKIHHVSISHGTIALVDPTRYMGKIYPLGSIAAGCGIKGEGQITRATVTATFTYHVLGFARKSSTSFTWLGTAQPPHWIEGEPIN
jgi:hypothetical protein